MLACCEVLSVGDKVEGFENIVLAYLGFLVSHILVEQKHLFLLHYGVQGLVALAVENEKLVVFAHVVYIGVYRCMYRCMYMHIYTMGM